MSDINKCLAACVEYRAKLDKLEAENEKLRNELARVNGQTMWICTCGGTDCAGLKENAELREALAIEQERSLYWRSIAGRKEAQP